MSNVKSTFIAAGAGLLMMTTFGVAQAGEMLAGPSPSTDVEQIVASIGPGGEIPLGLLIKNPETPHGASFNRQIASLALSSISIRA